MVKTRKRKEWTDEEIRFALRKLNAIPDNELELILDRSISNIRTSLRKRFLEGTLPKINKPYSTFEDEFILDNYGNIELDEICLKLVRTRNSIITRIYNLTGSSDMKDVTGCYGCTDIAPFMGVNRTTVSRIAKKYDIFKRVGNTYLIEQELFWNWLKDNTNYVNVKSVNDSVLIYCPEWYIGYINKEKFKIYNEPKKGKVLDSEIVMVKNLKKLGYTQRQIAEQMNRSFRSIKGICERYGLQEKRKERVS